MKLAFCLFKYFPFGGLQRDFLRIARLCRDRGHEVHVYTLHWEGEHEPGFSIHLLKKSGWQNHARAQHFIQQMQTELRATHFDAVIGFNKMPGLDFYYAADVCYQARVHTQRPWWYRLLPRYQHWLAAENAVFSTTANTNILLIAPQQQNEFAYYYQTPAYRFHILPPGIDRNRLPPSDAPLRREQIRAQFNVRQDSLILLMVGSGFKTKGVDRSIRALAALPDSLKSRCELWIIGQDNSTNFLTLAKQLQINDQIKFLGAKTNVGDFFLAADLLLHPSYHENTGTVILEAMINGLPVLTVASCGYAHFVSDAQAGMVLANPFSQEKMNNLLQTMLLAPEQVQWKKNGLTFGQTADIYHMPEKVVQYIEDIATPLPFPRQFTDWMNLHGECFRQHKNRLTQRVKIADQYYFIKQHRGIGWMEIIKNLLQIRLPIVSAKNEWLAIYKLKSLGVAVPDAIAYAERGINPAKKESYILLSEVTPAISLEDLIKTPLPPRTKRLLLMKIAEIARIMHENNINHRDFYLCHFLLDTTIALSQLNYNNIKLTLIDLHRTLIHKKIPQRWIVKDLAGLYFSSLGIQLTQRDYLRFIKYYREQSLRVSLSKELSFWQAVKQNGDKLYRDHNTA